MPHSSSLLNPQRHPTNATKPPLVTAAQIETDCPIEVQDLGRQLAAHYDKLIKCEDKAEQHKIAIGQLLVRAKEACDAGGFTAFRERFCPDLGQSRAYELLQIASGKKTDEETKAATRNRVQKHRASKKLSRLTPAPKSEPEPDSVTVTESVEINIEQRRAEHAALDLSPEERAETEFADWLKAADEAAKASAHGLAEFTKEFTKTCHTWLPKVTEQFHRDKARRLAGKMTEPLKAEEAEQSGAGRFTTLGSAIKRDWCEAERVFEALTSHTPEQVAKAIPPSKVPLIIEIADFFTLLVLQLTAPPARNGGAPIAWDSIPDDLNIPHCLRRGGTS
jgi:hypothetical protein